MFSSRYIFLGIFLTSTCLFLDSAKTNATPGMRIDSAHSVALKGVIKEGLIVSGSNNEVVINAEIKSQLLYTIGHLNGLNGVADLAHVNISLQSVNELPDKKFRISYIAELRVMLPKEVPFPEILKLKLPLGGDFNSRSKFYDAYGEKCLDHSAHDVAIENFWYFYRPEEVDCPLNNENPESDLTSIVAMELSPSAEQTEGKFPEYHKVWEDEKLVFTAIFGKNEAGSTSNWDAGVNAYVRLYDLTLAQLGVPDETTLAEGQRPAVENPQISLKFFLPDERVIEINLFLVDNIQFPPNQFYEAYKKLTTISDFISYNGHSGLGANIRALARMGKFVEGQYQIFLINGCDTFAYVDDALKAAHSAVNPGFEGDKYLDIITNSMPAFFHENAPSNIAFLKALIEAKKTYREILSGIDTYQRALVSGEQDNNYPDPF